MKPYEPKDNSSDEDAIRNGKNTRHSFEGEKHKALKEYIYNHPEAIGIKKVAYRYMEYTLLSGDRLDVFLKLKDGTQIAVEVKSEISDDADILRGIYQCVKYDAVSKAERCVHCAKVDNYPVREILVLEGKIPAERLMLLYYSTFLIKKMSNPKINLSLLIQMLPYFCGMEAFLNLSPSTIVLYKPATTA